MRRLRHGCGGLAALFTLTATALQARATPNAQCVAWCNDNPEVACGEAADCPVGDTCNFDQCVPGGGFAVERVVPEEVTDLNTWDNWDFPSYDRPPYDDGALTVSVAERWLRSGPTKSLPIEHGKRYFVRAEIDAEPGASGFLSGRGQTTGRAFLSDWAIINGNFAGQGPWVGFVVDNSGPDQDEEIQLRFEAAHYAGEGKVHLRNVALVELRSDFGLFVRLTTQEPTPAGTLWAIPTFCSGNDFDPIALAPGGSTGWIDLGALYPACATATIGFVFTPDPETPADDWTVEVEAAWRVPDVGDSSPIVLDRTVSGTTTEGFLGVGFYTSGPLPSPLGYTSSSVPLYNAAHRFGLLADGILGEAQSYEDRYVDYAPLVPQRIGNITWTNWWGAWGDYSALHGLYGFFHQIGINGLAQVGWPAETPSLSAAGMTKVHGIFPLPNVREVLSQTYDLTAVDDELETKWNDALDSHAPALQAAFQYTAESPGDLQVQLVDEPQGLQFHGPEYHEAFRAYLRAKALNCPDPGDPESCSPLEMFGKPWEEIFALEDMNETCIDAPPPDPEVEDPCPDKRRPALPDADPYAARLYYWQMRFWSEASAQEYARATAFLVSHSPGPVPPRISPQFGTPFGGYMNLRSGTELQTFIEAGAITGFHGEAVTTQDWCLAQDISTYADWVDGQLAPHSISRRASHVHIHRGSSAHKALALASRGIDFFSHYGYGPTQVWTDGIVGLGEVSEFAIRNIHQAGAVLAKTEGILAGAHRTTGPVAILATQSDPLWSPADYPDGFTTNNGPISRDESGTYLALLHQHFPVQFLVEGLLPDTLGADTKVLFVHRKHVSEQAFTTIKNWVEQEGGTLVLVGELPTYDEYGLFQQDRLTWLGVDEQPIAPPADFVDVTWSSPEAPISIRTDRPLRVLTPADLDATVIATYGGDPGQGAVVDLPKLAGHIRIFGFEMGSTYYFGTEHDDDACMEWLPGSIHRFRQGYLADVRAAVWETLGIADVTGTRPAWADNPLVEVIHLQTATGGAVSLLNYTNDPDLQVTVTIPGLTQGQNPHTVISPAPLTVDAEGNIQLSLPSVEMVAWDDPQ